MIKRFEALSLAIKSRILIVLVGVALATLAGLAAYSLSTLAERMSVIAEETLPEVRRADALDAMFSGTHLETMRYINWTFMGVPQDTVEHQAGVIAERMAEVKGVIDAHDSGEAMLDSEELIEEIRSYHSAAIAAVEMLALDRNMGGLMVNQVDEAYTHLNAMLSERIEATTSAGTQNVEDVAAFAERALTIYVAMAAASLLLVLTTTTLIVRSVNRPMMAMVAAMRELAHGSLDVHIPSEGAKNEVGEMAGAVAVFRDNAKARRALEEEEEQVREAAERRARKSAALQSELAIVLESAAAGDFSSRLAENNGVKELDELALSMNRLLENTQSTFEGVEHELLRLADVDGDAASMSQTPVEAVESALKTLAEGLAERARLAEREEAEALAKAARDKAVAHFEAEMSAVVNAASKGNFGMRLDETISEESLAAISRRMNMLLSGVDEAVTAVSIVLRAFANGDLTAQMTGEFEGVFADLRQDANTTGAKLRELVTEITREASSLNLAAEALVSGAGDLSERAASQAASLEETNAAMQVLSEAVKQNATQATAAASLASETNTLATNGGDTAREARIAMDEVDKTAEQIQAITSLVNDIAFQTNLLSLNAGVEAARAGAAGQGFAVVAHEVRALSQRAADAAREIKDLTERSVQSVAKCSQLVEASSAAFGEVDQRISKVASAFSAIDEASKEQSLGIEEVRGVVAGLDEQTQNNARLATKSADAASGLVAQAQRLTSLVSFFDRDFQGQIAEGRAA